MSRQKKSLKDKATTVNAVEDPETNEHGTGTGTPGGESNQSTPPPPSPSEQKTSGNPAINFEPLPYDAGKVEEVAGVKFNWDAADYADSFINQKTAESNALGADEDDDDIEEPTEEEKKNWASGAYEPEQEMMSLDDLLEVSRLIIDLIDAVNSTAVGAFAGEKPSQFQLEASQRKSLAGFMAKVFFKYQVKMGPMAALIFALILYVGLTWKTGWEVKRDKKIAAEREAAERQKAKNRAKLEAFQNKIIATLDVERLTLKEISSRMGMEEKVIKPELTAMMSLGTVKADHSNPPALYSIAR